MPEPNPNPFTEEQIGSRIEYTGRNNNVRYGSIKGYAGIFVDLKLDGSNREHFYVPWDTVKIIEE